ncbi:hypothetical protein DNP35_24920, partial [Salmonella enterica subsp. enterica serovar Panama]
MISGLDKRSQRRMREIDLERAKEAQERREDQKNSKFTQVSPKGWERIRELSKDCLLYTSPSPRDGRVSR